MNFVREQGVRFAHCDPAGIVFFPRYLVMLNELVEDWFDRALQIPYARFICERRLGLPTVRLECDFTAPSRVGDKLLQHLALQRIGRSSLALAVELHCNGQARMRAQQVLVCTSLDTHRPHPLPADLRDALVRFAEAP